MYSSLHMLQNSLMESILASLHAVEPFLVASDYRDPSGMKEQPGSLVMSGSRGGGDSMMC